MSYPKLYPKYDDLDKVIPEIDSNVGMNIIIDMKSFFNIYYNKSYNYSGIRKMDIEKIIMKAINSIGHFRNYFNKRKIQTYFYLLNSETKCMNLLELIPNYKKTFYEKLDTQTSMIKDYMFNSFEIINDVVNKLPNSMYINTSKFDENVYMRTIISNTDKVTMILSNSSMELMALLDYKTFILESWTNEILLKRQNVLDTIESIVVGSKDYDLKSSWCSIDKFNESWRDHINKYELYDLNTINNPIKYDRIIKRIGNKKSPSIDKSILKYREVQDFNFSILSGSKFYYENKEYLNTKIKDYNVDSKMSYQEALKVNDVFEFEKINVDMIYK